MLPECPALLANVHVNARDGSMKGMQRLKGSDGSLSWYLDATSAGTPAPMVKFADWGREPFSCLLAALVRLGLRASSYSDMGPSAAISLYHVSIHDT